MSRTLYSVFALTILLFSWSCNNTAESGAATSAEQENEAPETEVEAGVPAPVEQAVPMQGDQYEIVVLDGTIKSPRKELRGKVGETSITVNYGSPAVNGRELWGGLVPFGKVSRTGANEAVKVTLSGPIKMGDQTIDAGTYSLFTLPADLENWSYIINTEADQWGAYEYKEAKDVARIATASRASETFSERMDFALVNNELQLHWGNLIVPITLAEASK